MTSGLTLPSPESLTSHDQQICSSLEEKLQVYAALSTLNGKTEVLAAGSRLLVQPHLEESSPPQAAALLAAAVKEGETLFAVARLGNFFLGYDTGNTGSLQI